MKNEEIYVNSRNVQNAQNAQNGDPSLKTEVGDDKDDTNMSVVRYDYLGKADMNGSYDAEDVKSKNFDEDSSLNNKLISTIESENHLNEEYKYGYDNEVLASQEMQAISKIMKSKNMTCVQNVSPENNWEDSNMLPMEGDESVGINQSGSFQSANNLNTEDKLNSSGMEKAGDYMYGMKSHSDDRSGSKSFEDDEIHGEKSKTGSSHPLEEVNMDGEGRQHTYFSTQRGHAYDELASNGDYGKMQYKEMKEVGKEYLHFDKREKDDERDGSGCRGVDAHFDAVESDINFYDQGVGRSEVRSEGKFEQEISDAVPPPKSEQGEKKSLPNFESNAVKTNGPAGIIAEENATDTQVHNERSDDSLSGAPCENDPHGADKNGNGEEALGGATWGDRQAKTNVDAAAVEKGSDRIKGNQPNEGDPPTSQQNDNGGSATRKEGTVESDSGEQNEGADDATGEEFPSSEQKVGHEKSVKNCANEKGTQGGENYGEMTGEDALVGKTIRSAIPSGGSNTEEFYNGVSVAAPVNVTRMKVSSYDAAQEGERDSNVTTVNSPPKEGSAVGGGVGDGGSGGIVHGDGTTKQEQNGTRGPSAEPLKSKDHPSDFKVTKLSHTNGKDNKDGLYSYMKASNAMDDTINSTISDNANEYELVEDGSEVKNEKEDPKIESENVQMESAYQIVPNNNKRRRDSFTNEEVNKERKLNDQNESPYASPEENVNKTFTEHAHGESYGEQKGEKVTYESCGKGQPYVNPQQGNQNKQGEIFLSYSKENLGGVIPVNKDNMTTDSSYDNGKSFTMYSSFDKSNVVGKVVQGSVDTNGAYVPTHPQPSGEDSNPNCKANITHNVNDAQIEHNADGYSQHIQVAAKSVKDNCNEYADVDNENNNLSDDGKNSSDDNLEKKDSNQFDVNDKKKTKADSETLLPIANISRIMKRILPASAKVAKESKDIIRECVTEFIQFLTSEVRAASDRCLRERRKTISGEDILFSMEKLGFNDYVEPLYEYLTKWKQLKGMNNSNCHEKKSEGSKAPLEENATMKKSLSDVNMNNNAIMGKGADNVILTKDT
ncbi:CCAAT-box DNA binding protein subunit B [Plasmodium vivax North Korean]|uniref:CCAAT-box DNA binding protein subunit B n=1 Tax=Plasmodium vivax North Korean TaxID=1035514 RepID=A0A0J9TX28_PLAVI|nr:CCAAT-box DNA binding protein subunit B [Plasmodium vivax North Korean]